MGLGNPLEVIIHYLLIERMVGLSHRDDFPMVSVLVCIVIHWTRPTVTYDFTNLLLVESCLLMDCTNTWWIAFEVTNHIYNSL